MESEKFENQMENLKKPGSEQVRAPEELKLAILNAQRSAAIGVWFVVVPIFFLSCIVMKYLFHVNLGFLKTFEEVMVAIDRNPGTWWIQPVLLIGLPAVGIIMNALSILHFSWGEGRRSLIITLKIRWMNIIVLLISLLIIKIFLLYLITENFQARPGH